MILIVFTHVKKAPPCQLIQITRFSFFREAGVESGHTIKVLFSEQKLYVKLPDGKLLEPAMTVNPLGVSVDDIRNYVQEHTNHSQFPSAVDLSRTRTQRRRGIACCVSVGESCDRT